MDRPAGWAERSDAMAMSEKWSQVGVRYKAPADKSLQPIGVDGRLPGRRRRPSAPTVQRRSCPSNRGGLSGPGMRVYRSRVPSRRIVNTHSSRSARAYGRAVSRALPNAVQVADRWHLLDNCGKAFLAAVRRSMPDIRKAFGSRPIDLALLTGAERLLYEGFQSRQQTNSTVRRMAGDGVPIK